MGLDLIEGSHNKRQGGGGRLGSGVGRVAEGCAINVKEAKNAQNLSPVSKEAQGIGREGILISRKPAEKKAGKRVARPFVRKRRDK